MLFAALEAGSFLLVLMAMRRLRQLGVRRRLGPTRYLPPYDPARAVGDWPVDCNLPFAKPPRFQNSLIFLQIDRHGPAPVFLGRICRFQPHRAALGWFIAWGAGLARFVALCGGNRVLAGPRFGGGLSPCHRRIVQVGSCATNYVLGVMLFRGLR